MSLIGYALRTAKQYYNPDTYKHALRVASFVADNIFIPDSKMDNCIALAIMHDLEEDTNWDKNKCYELDEYLKESIGLITRKKNVSYIEYIKKYQRKYGVVSRSILGKDCGYERSFSTDRYINRQIKREIYRSIAIFAIKNLRDWR